jgi:hypothetical protein
MKKVFLLPLFAMAVFASGAWAGDFCDFGPCEGSSPDGYGCEQGGCYRKSGQPNGVCGQYSDEVSVCPENTLPPKIKEEGGYSSSGEWCRWATSCWPISNAPGARDQCVAGGYVYTGVPSSGESKTDGDGKQCEGGHFTGEGKSDDPGAVRDFCNWGDCEQDPSNDFSCLSGGCFEIMTEKQRTDCGNNVIPASTGKAGCPLASLPIGDRTSIVSMPKAQGLTIMANGKVLHILSVRDAQVSLFDLSGSLVLSGNVKAGNSEFSLKTLKQGIYYAKVQSGSHTQTVKVMLK